MASSTFGILGVNNVVLKITLLFQDFAAGWSETYYCTIAETAAPRDKVNKLVDERVKVLGTGSLITFARFGFMSEGIKPTFVKVGRAGAALTAIGGAATEKADQASAALLMPYKTTGNVRRFVTLSGFPDDWMIRDTPTGPMNLTGRGREAVNAFYKFLREDTFGLVVRLRLRTGVNAPTGVQNIELGDGGRYKITLAGAAPIPSMGTRVVFNKIKGNNLQFLKGLRRVYQPAAPTSFLVNAGPRADLGDIVYQGGGTMSVVDYDYSPVSASVEDYRISTRKRGRPFAERAGRRSARR